MGAEVAAVVDLRNLTQSDLVALAATSPYAVDPARGRRRDDDFLPPPKIDRAIFNESAGSRKQTFSRRRVATNISHNLDPTAAAASSSAAAAPSEDDSENRLIVFHLQRLFAREDPSYPPPTPIPSQPQTLTAPTSAAPAPSLPPTVAAVDPDREVMNPKGVPVDLVRLAELVEPFGEELQKRTAGLGSESELLGFMNSLEGQWGSRRRRRKFVDAAIFGDRLPRGWKLLLGLKRKERVAWINCRRYVSPKGHQFASCKEVASYLMSLLGYPEAKQTGTQSSNTGVHAVGVLNTVGLHQQSGSTECRPIAMPITPVALPVTPVALPVTLVSLLSHSGDSHQQKLQNDEIQLEANIKGCRKCNLTFHDQSAYMQHQLSFHQRKAKRRRVGSSDDLGTSIGGKSEPQGFQNTSEGGPGIVGDSVGQLSVPSGLKEMTALSEQEKQHSAIDPGFGNHKNLLEQTSLPEQEKGSAAGQLFSGHPKDHIKELPGFPEKKNELSAGEPVSQHHQNPAENSDDLKDHDGAGNKAVASVVIDAENKHNPCNSENVRGDGNSRDLEPSTVDFSQNVNRPGEICIIPTEVSQTTDGPDENKSTDDAMKSSDIAQSKQVSEPYDLTHGKFEGSKENNLLSMTLDEPDLNSDVMEVDDGKAPCNVANPTRFENDKPVEDKIMDCGLTLLRDDKIKNDVRIRDVNLNSCSDAISSPVSGGNYETSNTPDDATRSSIIAQCFGTSSNDDNVCKDGNFANQDNACKSENFIDQKNDMAYQSSLTMDPIPPPQINVDCFTSSCSMAPEIKSYNNRCEDSAKEAMANSRSMMSNETGFDVEAYGNDIFNGTITESSLAQLNNAMNMKTDFTSCYSLSELNTLTGSTATDEIDIHGMRSSFVNSTSRNGPHEHCTLDFDIKGSMLEALEKSDSDLENQYNGAGPTCDSLPAPSTGGNIDDFMSMQTNFGSFTSLVRAVEDVPLSRIIQDQCDLQLGFGGPKQPIYPTFEQQLRMASAGAPPYGTMGRHDAVPVPEPTLMLGYAPQLGSCPPFQLSWGPPLSKMVGGCVLQCVWCNSQFQHFGTVAEQQADSLGYICPACKGKFSGHLGINGPSL